jgi:uncharacterized protein
MLRSLEPRLMDGVYAFCRLDGDAVPKSAIGWFREAEGATVILPLADAQAEGFAVDFEAAWIALGVESSLSAVGLTATVATALASEGIACNVVAACRHDHLFVPISLASDAMGVLARLGE